MYRLKVSSFSVVVIIVLISGCIQQQEAPATTTLSCGIPYIKVGNACCLDENADNICDKDKPFDTTTSLTALTIPGTTSILIITSTTSTSTIITTTSLCKKNEDCGNIRIENICVAQNKETSILNRITIKNICKYPNTEKAKCITNKKTEKLETCGNYILCKDNQCPRNCYNGVQDPTYYGELGVDCGGNCIACRKSEIIPINTCLTDADCRGLISSRYDCYGHQPATIQKIEVCVIGRLGNHCEVKEEIIPGGAICVPPYNCVGGQCVRT